jgi:hypothetical protein
MRGYRRYKIFQKGYNLNCLPTRILNLKRPKWDFIKLKAKRSKVLKKVQISTVNFFKVCNITNLLLVLRRRKLNTLQSTVSFFIPQIPKKVRTLKDRY